MSGFVLPTEFTLESVSACFASVFAQLADLSKKNEEIGSVANSKITLQEVLSAFVEKPKNSLAVDMFAVDGLLKGITQKVLTELQGLEQHFNSLVSTNEKLFMQINQATRALKKKAEEISEKFENFVEYTKGQFLKLKLEKKKKFVFEGWKKETKKQRKLANMLKKSLIQIHRFKLKTGFMRWKALETKIHNKQLENEKLSILRVTNEIQHEFDTIKSEYWIISIYTLAVDKADLIEVNDLKALATKTDLRVLYNDMREILVSYFNNLRTSSQSKLEQINKVISEMQESLASKADTFTLEEVNTRIFKLNEEISATNQKHQQLTDQFYNFSKSAQVQKTHFQLELLEKKISCLEGKYSLEKSQELDFAELIRMSDSRRTMESEELKRSKKLTEILEKPSVHTRKRNSFHTVVTNKRSNQ